MIMKKYIFVIAAIAALMVSCTKENNLGQNGKLTFSVTKEAIGSTKAELSGTNVNFAAGDKISVFAGLTNHEFTTTAGGSTATFTSGESVAELENYLVLSPYNADATRVDVGSMQVRITIPSEQVATPGGVDPKALISAGIATGTGSVELKNAVGLVKIVVPDGLTVKTIQVAGGKAATIAIAGEFNFNAENGALAIPDVKKTTQIITLVPKEGDDVIAPGTYYVAVRPKTTYDAGFMVAYVNGSNQLCKRSTATALDIIRSHIVPVGSLGDSGYTPVSGTAVLRMFGDYGNPWQFTGLIKYMAGGSGTASADDNVVKKIIFKSHAIIPNEKKTSAGTVSSGAGTESIFTYIDGDVVYVCTEASKITLNATSSNLFRNFLALEEVIFDDVDTQAGASFEYMFRNDTKLKKVDFGNADFSKVTNFSYMFYTGASALEYVNLGGTATTSATTMQSMFNNNQNLKHLDLGANFTLAATHTNMFLDAARQTSIDASGDDAKKCQLYCSQAFYDDVRVNEATFNAARFFLHVQ